MAISSFPICLRENIPVSYTHLDVYKRQIWHRENETNAGVDSATAPGGQAEASLTTHGFDWSGLDFHTGGTLAKNFSFYVLPSSDNTGAFHFETVFARIDNVGGSSWFNIKLGKFELDNLLSEKRILTLTNVSGVYTNYHYQPLVWRFSHRQPSLPGRKSRLTARRRLRLHRRMAHLLSILTGRRRCRGNWHRQ